MSKRMYCSHCGAYVGDCGHEPGVTDPVTLSGTCKCGRKFTVTCNGDCLNEEEEDKMKQDLGTCKTCSGTGRVAVSVKIECTTCDGSGKVLGDTCQTCIGSGKMDVAKEVDCPTCKK